MELPLLSVSFVVIDPEFKSLNMESLEDVVPSA